MKLEITAKAEKQFKKLTKKEQVKIGSKLQKLISTPYSGKKLKGELSGFYSLRSWPYRIIYGIDKNIITVYIIEHRQSAYKN